MNKYLLIGLLAVVCGCQEPPKLPPPAPMAPIQAPPAKPEEKPTTPPQVAPPSTDFLKGYNDGYYGTWLAPGKWTVNSEYRSGWSAGNFDRKQKNPHKYDPKK